MVDLRSDTVTRPTSEMREAMARAEVGDDVYGEDPTINRLEELAAGMLGKEAAVFVPSGTMANLVSLLAHTERGDEVIVGHGSHIFGNEVASAAVVGGLQFQPIDDETGHVTCGQVEEAIRGQNIHWPRTRLLCLENTHNRAGGVVQTVEETRRLVELANSREVLTHLDGARLFNAATYLAMPAAKLAEGFDSVYVCLSKGLAAPVGSLTCGRRDFVERARKYRKMVGGGMRQAGILAAAGIIALEKMALRLDEDHRTARRIAEGLVGIPGIELDLGRVQTNIIRMSFSRPDLTAADISGQLRQRDIIASPGGAHAMRLVTHYQVSMQDADSIVAAFRDIMGAEAQVAAGAGSSGSPY